MEPHHALVHLQTGAERGQVSETIYLDLPSFLRDCQAWITEKTPLVVEPKRWRTGRVGVLLTARKGKNRKLCMKFTKTYSQAEVMAGELRKRFKRTLHHVA